MVGGDDADKKTKPFFNGGITTGYNNSYILILRIQSHSFHAAGEFYHFPRLNLVRSINTCNSIPNRYHSTDLIHWQFGVIVGNSFFRDSRSLFRCSSFK